MHDESCMTTSAIQEAFSEEIALMGGRVTDVFDDGSRLFARAVMPKTFEVLPKDNVQGGVALRASSEEVWVHPYVFRQVCSNGAVLAQAMECRRIEGLSLMVPYEAEAAIREAVRGCYDVDGFSGFAQQMRASSKVPFDFLSGLTTLMAGLPARNALELMDELMLRFAKDKDHSRFGLMNAVTSLARDTSDPETRWRLEEFGGGVPARLHPAPGFDGGRERLRAGAPVRVGSH
jgi:hypothetical protein